MVFVSLVNEDVAVVCAGVGAVENKADDFISLPLMNESSVRECRVHPPTIV